MSPQSDAEFLKDEAMERGSERARERGSDGAMERLND